jgi:hypothetical protein
VVDLLHEEERPGLMTFTGFSRNGHRRLVAFHWGKTRAFVGIAVKVPFMAVIMTSHGKQQQARVHLTMIVSSISVRKIARQVSLLAARSSFCRQRGLPTCGGPAPRGRARWPINRDGHRRLVAFHWGKRGRLLALRRSSVYRRNRRGLLRPRLGVCRLLPGNGVELALGLQHRVKT